VYNVARLVRARDTLVHMSGYRFSESCTRALSAFLVCAVVLLAYSPILEASQFGGRIGDGARCDGRALVNCYNQVIWAGIGAPRGGNYIWAPGVTRTYEFGPPSKNGQWLLGLYAPPYFCVARLLPLIVCPGIIMTMLGSSGGSLNTQMQFTGQQFLY